MSGISYTMPRFQAIDQNGNPMVGATLYTYQNKTTTPHPTWKDKDQTAYNTNPIVLDARGEAVIWLDPEQVYTFVLRDWFGVLVWSQDDIAGTASQIDLAAPDGASMVGFIQAGTGAVPRTMLDKAREVVSVRDFGAVGDGVTDDTAALQEFADHLSANHCVGRLPRGTYLISSRIVFPTTYGWGLIGEGPFSGTTLLQATDNEPILQLGTDALPQNLRGYLLEDIGFDYVNHQPHTNTDANPIYFHEMGYDGVFRRLTFYKGSWAIKVRSGVGGPWGQDWSALVFYPGLSGGAMDWTGAIMAVPNNRWGQFLVLATGMVGPIFKAIKGYCWSWDGLEILEARDIPIMTIGSGSVLNMTSFKMEFFNYTASSLPYGYRMIDASDSFLNIDEFSLGGTEAKCNFPEATSLLHTSTYGGIRIRNLYTNFSEPPSNLYVVGGNVSNGIEINYRSRPVTSGDTRLPYTNVASSSTSDYLTVYPDKNDKLSYDKGDADYTFAPGDPTVVVFQTPLTSQREVQLPAGNYCFNGLKVRVVSNGAVNGVNTLVIRSGGIAKGRLDTDNSWIEFNWRRDGGDYRTGWTVVGSGTIDDGLP